MVLLLHSSMGHKVHDLVVSTGCSSWGSSHHHPQQHPPKDIGSATPGTDENFAVDSKGPFAGLTICVTGLSKDARRRVQATTERLGGLYSPDLHLGCTHLVVQSSGGRKLYYALKHRKPGLFVVTLSWFINSAKAHERLDEAQYDATKIREAAEPEMQLLEADNACAPQAPDGNGILVHSKHDGARRKNAVFSNLCFYIDVDVSGDLQTRVVEACVKDGGTCISDWYIGCKATHIICEANALAKYVGYKTHLVSPLWILKTVKERSMQHLVHISHDLIRHLPALLEQMPRKEPEPKNGRKLLALCGQEESRVSKLAKAEETVRAAKASIRRRRGPHCQPCRLQPRAITPQSMMESICWSISEPPSTAQFYLDHSECEQASDYFDADSVKEASEVSLRPLNESEKQDVLYKGAFLTVLFPVDRFSEMGPSSRSFFSETGFSRQQILECVYSFYQEPLSNSEIKVAIHTDSKHSDRLRAVFAAPETLEAGYVQTRRYEFLGSRRNFEGLRRLSIENNGQVYQLCLSIR